MSQELIDKIMDEFNFERVHKAMVALNWEWSGSDGVPTIGELRRQARQLLKELTNNKNRVVGTGGFYAYQDFETVGLRFELSRYETECR